MGSIWPSCKEYVDPALVNSTVNVSSETGTAKLTEPFASVVSPVSVGTSWTVNACDAQAASRKRSVTVVVGGSVWKAFVVPVVRFSVAAALPT
jgi:hypothetical protein